MKSRLSSFLLMALAAGLASPATAIAGVEVGKGGFLKTVGNDLELGDHWVPRDCADCYVEYRDLPEQLRREIERIGTLLVRFGGAVAEKVAAIPEPIPSDQQKADTELAWNLSRVASSRFMEGFVFSRRVEYRFVPELKRQCRGLDEDQLAVGGETVQVACTKGVKTYIVTPLFRKLTLRQQALLLVHERLHELNSDLDHQEIADIVDGLDTALSLLNEQVAGKRRRLDDTEGQRDVHGRTEAKRLEMLIRKIMQYLGKGNREAEDEFLSRWRVHPYGGGLVHEEASVAEDAFVGIGSLIGKGGQLASGSEVIYSVCYTGSCVLRPGAQLFDSTFSYLLGGLSVDVFNGRAYGVVLGESARVVGSNLSFSLRAARASTELLSLEKGSALERANVAGVESIRLAESSFVDQVNLVFMPDPNSSEALRLVLGRRAQWLGLDRSVAVRVLPAAPTKDLTLTVGEREWIDFEHKPVCSGPELVFLSESIKLEGEDAPLKLKSACRKFSDVIRPPR